MQLPVRFRVLLGFLIEYVSGCCLTKNERTCVYFSSAQRTNGYATIKDGTPPSVQGLTRISSGSVVIAALGPEVLRKADLVGRQSISDQTVFLCNKFCDGWMSDEHLCAHAISLLSKVSAQQVRDFKKY